jgi:hypothetical protein
MINDVNHHHLVKYRELDDAICFSNQQLFGQRVLIVMELHNLIICWIGEE